MRRILTALLAEIFIAAAVGALAVAGVAVSKESQLRRQYKATIGALSAQVATLRRCQSFYPRSSMDQCWLKPAQGWQDSVGARGRLPFRSDRGYFPGLGPCTRCGPPGPLPWLRSVLLPHRGA